MSRLFIISALIFTFGCAQVQVVSFQNRPDGRVFKLCGNKFAGEKDFEKAAAQQCASDYKVLGGGLENAGYYSSSSYSSYGNNGYGNSYAVPIKVACYAYQCTGGSNGTPSGKVDDISADNCRERCRNLYRNNQLGPNMDVSDCFESMCVK